MIVDNLLWGGKVASGDAESSTVALREFNPYFMNHPQLLAEVLPVGDGLGYAVKTLNSTFAAKINKCRKD